MKKRELINGFSKLSREEKLRLISEIVDGDPEFSGVLEKHLYPEPEIQKKYQNFSENTLSNYFLPYGIAPNFLINGKVYHIPFVTEESSVVAAAASAAKFWSERGGFQCKISDTLKTGQVHFKWSGDPLAISSLFRNSKDILLDSTSSITAEMIKRGGGIKAIELIHKPEVFEEYYQIDVEFTTADSMGANFINTCLEKIADTWKDLVEGDTGFGKHGTCTIIMSILSNYTPNCIVTCTVRDEVKNMSIANSDISGEKFCETFVEAVQIADNDVFRAVTHNKGIFNGIDAVVLATGNDFRAVEANGHAYAARGDRYRSLSRANIEHGLFSMELELPMAIGTVGGLTKLHPLANYSLKILGEPGAMDLMKIVASAGLASNFSALRSLTTSGIQQGHMKLHLINMLNQLKASKSEIAKARKWFSEKTVSYRAVEEFIQNIRN